MKKYRSRILDALLSKRLQAKGAVLIEGPKWCGKTTTSEQIAREKIMLARADVKESFKRLLEIDSEEALSGATPLLIDEWQTVPKLWDAVRYAVDQRGEMGQFILTGFLLFLTRKRKQSESIPAWGVLPGSSCVR